MSRISPFDELAALRDEARILVQRASDHEHNLNALVAAAEIHERYAEDAVSEALEGTRRSVEHLRRFLSAVLQRSHADVDTARQVYASAHEQHVAADVLLTHLEGHCSQEQMIARGPRRDAVLVVEDYGAVREVIADVLGHAGFVVRTAANGLEGLLVAHEMRPAVIVMDLTMPVLDGMTATRLIKASEATHHARVIAYTAGLVSDRRLFTAVVQKPATPAALLATVRQVAHL